MTDKPRYVQGVDKPVHVIDEDKELVFSLMEEGYSKESARRKMAEIRLIQQHGFTKLIDEGFFDD